MCMPLEIRKLREWSLLGRILAYYIINYSKFDIKLHQDETKYLNERFYGDVFLHDMRTRKMELINAQSH
jgi:hypothetical protein